MRVQTVTDLHLGAPYPLRTPCCARVAAKARGLTAQRKCRGCGAVFAVEVVPALARIEWRMTARGGAR